MNEVTGEDISEFFEKFCNTDYIDIINRECDAEIAEKKIPSPYPVEAFADDEEKSKRLVFLEQATAAQRSAAESEVEKAWLNYRSKQPMETAKYLSQKPPSKFAVQTYFGCLKNLMENDTPVRSGLRASAEADSGGMDASDHASTMSDSPTSKRSSVEPEAVVSPVRRKKQRVAPPEPSRLTIGQIHAEGKIGDSCHFEGCFVYCENELRNIEVKNPRNGAIEDTPVLNLTCADEGGSIQVTLWREVAEKQFAILDRALDSVTAGHCPKLMLTYMILREPRNTAVQSVKVLHSTEKTVLTLHGEMRLVMTPEDRFLVTDFQKLKVQLPFTAHLKGVVVGEISERVTAKGQEQIRFTLMDRFRRSVNCIAHDTSANKDIFAVGSELVIFNAVGTEGLKKAPGSVWIYGDSYVMRVRTAVLPGLPREEIRLTS